MELRAATFSISAFIFEILEVLLVMKGIWFLIWLSTFFKKTMVISMFCDLCSFKLPITRMVFKEDI